MSTEKRDAFAKSFPKLEAELSLGENNPDFRGLGDLNARHAYAKFCAGWHAAIAARGIVSRPQAEPDAQAAGPEGQEPGHEVTRTKD